MKWLGAKARRRHPLNWASSFFAARANRSTHTPARGRPRGCRLVYRTGRGDGGTDSAMQTSVRRPIATVPSRCRGPCDASPAMAECHEFVTRVGFPPHRSRGRQPRNLADTVAVHVHPGVAESHRPAPVLLASHSGWHRSAGRRAARLARHKSDDACSLAWRDPWDLDQSADRRTPRGPSSCPQSLGTNRCRLRTERPYLHGTSGGPVPSSIRIVAGCAAS